MIHQYLVSIFNKIKKANNQSKYNFMFDEIKFKKKSNQFIQ